MFAFPCLQCKATLRAPEEKTGALTKCPHCGNPVKVPKPPVFVSTNTPTVVSFDPKKQSSPAKSKIPLLVAGGTGVFIAGVCTGSLLLFLVLWAGGWIKGTSNNDGPSLANRSDKQTEIKPTDEILQFELSREDKQTDKSNEDGFKTNPGKQPSYTVVKVDEIYKAYEGNAAGADANYLNKTVQFELTIDGIDKDGARYYAWANIFHLPDPVKWGQHFKCHFRADQEATLAKFKLGQNMTIRGVCVGKTGMISTYLPGYNGANGQVISRPAIAFRECEIVK